MVSLQLVQGLVELGVAADEHQVVAGRQRHVGRRVGDGAAVADDGDDGGAGAAKARTRSKKKLLDLIGDFLGNSEHP